MRLVASVVIICVALVSACSFSGAGSQSAGESAESSPATVAPSSGATAVPQASTSRSKSSAVNVLFITIDTLRADHLGAYGNMRVKTPTLDALAYEGVRFERAIVQFSQTNPSHASLFTGTYPATHGVRVHGVDKVSPAVVTLAEVLASRGYETAGIYSWPSLDPDMSGFDRGFASYRGVYAAIPGLEGHPDFWRRWSARADITTDSALEWLATVERTSFFLWIHYQDPHFPFTAPPPFDLMYAADCATCADGWDSIDRAHNGSLTDADIARMIARYDGAISYTDHQIGRIVQHLRDSNLLDSTLIVVTADHGESFNDNGVWFHPFILYNSVVRVPLIVRNPMALPANIVIDAVVQSIDVMPTILELTGIENPNSVEGSSVLPLVWGVDAGTDRIAIVQVPHDAKIALVTREWKLIRSNGTGALELYDLRADPLEHNNLATTNVAEAAELEARLKAWMNSHGISPER